MPSSYSFERFLNIRSAYAPCFSHDGQSVMFVTDMTGVPQVWSVRSLLEWPTQITFGTDRMFYAVSAHGSDRWVVGGDLGGDERVQMQLLEGQTGAFTPLVPNPRVIYNFGGWSPDDKLIAYSANVRSEADFDIYVLDISVEGARPRLVWQQDGSNTVAAWSPDGKALLVHQMVIPANHNLYLVLLDGGEPRLLTPHEGDATYNSVQWSPDGHSLYMTTDEGREFSALVRFDLNTGERETIAKPSWDVYECALSPDGRRLAYAVNAAGYSELYVRQLDTGEDKRPDGLPRGVIPGSSGGDVGEVPAMAWSPDGNQLAFNFTTPSRNLDVWVWDVSAGRAQSLTRSGMANIPPSSFVEPQLISYPTFDGRDIPAFLYMPHAAQGKQVPCILHVHGGPESQVLASFSAIFQYFVQRGYAVLAPNVRGSSGYGRQYVHLDDVRLRMDSVRDVAAAVGWLRNSGQVDPKKIAVMGGSYGGFMVLASVTTYPDLWAAAVDLVGIANFETFLENTGPWRRKLREAEYGSLERDRDFLREISPIHRVDNIVAPLMVIQGANDPRVPAEESEQIVASMRRRGYPVEYLLFADEGHGVVKLKNRLVAYPAIGDFLDKYLAG